MRSLVWFTRDLRVHDQPALKAAANGQQLLCVYVVDPRWFRPRQWQTKAMGPRRWRFLWQSLLTLDKQLRARQQRLHIAFGLPEQEIMRLCEQHGITHVFAGQSMTVDELNRWGACKDGLPQLSFYGLTTTTLLSDTTEIDALQGLPEQLGQYRQRIANAHPAMDFKVVDSADIPLPPAPGVHDDERGQCPPVKAFEQSINGGELEALASLQRWHDDEDKTASAWQPMSLAPWVANGCLSVRHFIKYAANHKGSTYPLSQRHVDISGLWLREFFQGHARRHWLAMHRRGGIDDKSPNGTFYPHRFKAWCEGETDNPLVNAAMHALNDTGQLSLMGRLAIAQYFVNVLQLDWRYGLAWVQHHALDYDDAVDSFVWQLAAGLTDIGADVLAQLPQPKVYDHDAQAFIDQWDGKVKHPMAMHVVDAADWPL